MKINKKFKFSKLKLSDNPIFDNNMFVFIFSVIIAICVWFYMAASDSSTRPNYIYDVPITIELSDAAQEEGVQVFAQDTYTATVVVSGNSMIIDRVTASDIEVVATLSPTINKITGKTTVTETIELTAIKVGNDLADYQVTGVTPSSIEVTYDRYKEKTFNVENNVTYTAAENYYVATANISDSYVVISGPESSLNQIDTVSIEHTVDTPLTTSLSFDLGIVLYDADGKVLDANALYLTTSVDTVTVDLEVTSKQTVTLETTILNLPTGFSDSRITVEPATIDIAGDYSVVSNYSTITLPTAIDFNYISTENATFEIEIPMPDNVKNITNVETATVTVNLSGYTENVLSTSQITISNVPDDKVVTLVMQSVEVTVLGTSAQVSKLDSDSVYGTIDMAGLTDINGDREVTVKIGLSGADSCWVYGTYTILVNVSDATEEASADITESSNSE